jgi:hypothetical protein
LYLKYIQATLGTFGVFQQNVPENVERNVKTTT